MKQFIINTILFAAVQLLGVYILLKFFIPA